MTMQIQDFFWTKILSPRAKGNCKNFAEQLLGIDLQSPSEYVIGSEQMQLNIQTRILFTSRYFVFVMQIV